MFHWLHHLLNPHCDQCQYEEEARKVCQSCETLKIQLAIANREKEQLLNSILESNKKPEAPASPPVNPEILKSTRMTWNVRRQMLEAEDREAAKLLAEQKKHREESKSPLTPGEKHYVSESIEKLEKELGVAQEEVKNSA